MRKEEANRLRDIANVLDDQYLNNTHIDGTYNQILWFHWGAEEIRKVLFNGGYNAFNDEKCCTTTTTQKENNHSRRYI